MNKAIFSAGVLAALASTALLTEPAKAHVALVQGNDVTITTTELGGGVYMLEGQGGNIGISVGNDGVFMIDDQYGRIADDILDAVAQVTDQPVAYVLNTHWHGDHTGGNEAMAATGATILSHDNVRARLKDGMPERNTAPAPDSALPVLTFSDTATFHWNGHDIHIYHFPNAHTDGDALVHFKDMNIMHPGDTFFSGRYPYIDLASGGSVDGYIANLEAVAALADDETKIIPGHGPLSGKKEVLDLIGVLKNGRKAVKALYDQGMSEDDIVAADPLAPWNDEYNWRFINGERMTRTLVQDLAQ